MALISEAEDCTGGEASSGPGYPAVGVGESLRDDLGIWNTGDDKYSGNIRICCKRATEAGWVSVVFF